MENIDENVDGPAASGQAADTPDKTDQPVPPASEGPPGEEKGDTARIEALKASVWEPPAYLKLIGEAIEACGAVQSAAEAAQDLRNLEFGSIDSDTPQILKAHVHALNGVFARLITCSMERPRDRISLIDRALRAQQQCVESMEALRQIRECELRLQKHGDNNSRDCERLRLMRIRITR